MTQENTTIDTEKLQLSVNELFGKSGMEKEEMFDILNEFILHWLLENDGYDAEIKGKALFLYFFFADVIREIEISFEEEIE